MYVLEIAYNGGTKTFMSTGELYRDRFALVLKHIEVGETFRVQDVVFNPVHIVFAQTYEYK